MEILFFRHWHNRAVFCFAQFCVRGIPSYGQRHRWRQLLRVVGRSSAVFRLRPPHRVLQVSEHRSIPGCSLRLWLCGRFCHGSVRQVCFGVRGMGGSWRYCPWRIDRHILGAAQEIGGTVGYDVNSLVGLDATVEERIYRNSYGKVKCSVNGTSVWHSARSVDGSEVEKGATVQVVKVIGNTLYVANK